MPRILFTSWYTGLGGGETDLLTLADALEASDFECQLLLPRDGQLGQRWRQAGRRTHFIRYRGATTWFLPAIWARLGVVSRFADLLKRERIDLVHADYHTLPMIAPAARRARVPLCWTVWGWWFRPKPWQRAFFRGLPAVARSKAIRAGFLGDPPFMPAEQLPVIYAGVDTSRFHPRQDGAALRRELGLSQDALVVAMAARFQRVKGHHTFQAMAEQVLAESPQTQFVIAGADVFGVAADQRYREEILERAQSSPILRDRLRYIGFRDDVEAVYAAADVFVCPSEFESYGKANLEAMACGKPVVSSRRGGPSETILDGVTGFLVESGDADAMAAQVLRLLREGDLRHQMGRAATEHASVRFSAGASAAAQKRYFDDLLRLS